MIDPELQQWIAAGDLVAFSFMREITIELAPRDSEPAEWAKVFIGRLTARVDQNEKAQQAMGVNEEARRRIDHLARAVQVELGRP